MRKENEGESFPQDGRSHPCINVGNARIEAAPAVHWNRRLSFLKCQISNLKNFEVDSAATIFNEFRVRSKKPFAAIESTLAAEGIFPGVALEPFYPEMKDQFLVCATETKSREDLDRFVEALARC